MAPETVKIEDLQALVKSLGPGSRPSEVLADTDLFAAGILDSLSIVQFVTLIEKKFSITFNYNDIRFENFRTLELLKTLLQKSYGL